MRKTHRVVLVNPDVSDAFRHLDCTYGKLPPSSALSLLACETERRLEANCIEVPEIVILDRPKIDAGFLVRCSQANILGFTTWFSNYEAAVSLARAAKQINSDLKVVVGGPDASNLNRRIVVNRPYVDYVCVGDGEDVLWRLIAGQSADTIPNLLYRNPVGEIRFSFNVTEDLDTLGLFDFRHVHGLDLSEYDTGQPGYRFDAGTIGLSISLTRGCHKATTSERCAYCTIPGNGLGVRCVSPRKAWQQIAHLRARYHVDSFFETGDDFTVGNYAESLLACDHAQHGIHLRAYISMWRLTASKAETFRHLGVANVFIGLETVDPKINRWSRRGVTAKTARNKLAMLQDNGILADMAIMFGMPGESLESLDEIEELVYELVDRFDNIRMVLISVGMPLIGSSWYEQLAYDPDIQDNYPADLRIIDVPDYSRLSELSVRRYCSATCADIVETMERLRHYLCERVVVGCFGALEKHWQQAPRGRPSGIGSARHYTVLG